MTEDEAKDALAKAVAERDAARTSQDNALAHLHEVIREANGVLRQVDIVKATGYTRERIRQITGEERA